jgi:tetratricopeptide (TPR) repeat protein
MDPENYKSLTQLGLIAFDLANYDKAVQLFEHAIKIRAYPLALTSMGQLLFKTGNFQQAVKYLETSLKLEAKDKSALICLGNCYSK